jgi:hypothetical protein
MKHYHKFDITYILYNTVAVLQYAKLLLPSSSSLLTKSLFVFQASVSVDQPFDIPLVLCDYIQTFKFHFVCSMIYIFTHVHEQFQGAGANPS